MFIPSCNHCGRCGCVCGRLPYTVTLQFSALKNEQLEGYLPITFQTAAGEPPAGCGASALAVANSSGQVVSVILLEHGHDYARPARIEPSVVASASGGTGAVLSVSLSPNVNDTWGVASVTVLNGGDGYETGASVVFDVGDGVEVVPAVATIVAGGPPSNDQIAVFEYVSDTSGPSNGSGATYDYTFTASGDLWLLAATVTSGGSGYAVGDVLEFARTGMEYGVSLYEVTSIDESGGITGISLTVAEAMLGSDGTISAVSVTTPGSYFAEDPAAPPVVDVVGVAECETSNATFSVSVDDAPESNTFGRVLSVSVDDPGSGCGSLVSRFCEGRAAANTQSFVLRADNPTKLVTLDVHSTFGSGACLRVVPVGNGTMCDEETPALYDGLPGPIRQVEIVDPGSGYARVTNGVVDVATVTVNVVQLPPSAGTGGAVSVTVDADPASPSFGRIVGASVTGGSGYVLLGGPRDCTWSKDCLSLTLRGRGNQPEVRYGETVFRMDGVLDNCDALPDDGTLFYGANAGAVSVSRGGAWDSCTSIPGCFCATCCDGAQQISICDGELTATVTFTITGSNKDGTYTLSVPMTITPGLAGSYPEWNDIVAEGVAETENKINALISVFCDGRVLVSIGDYSYLTGGYEGQDPFCFCNCLLSAAGDQAGVFERDYTEGCGFDWGTELPGWTAINPDDSCPSYSFDVSIAFGCT